MGQNSNIPDTKLKGIWSKFEKKIVFVLDYQGDEEDKKYASCFDF